MPTSPFWPRLPARIILLSIQALLPCYAVGQPPLDKQVPKAVSAFGRKSANQQERILTDVCAAMSSLESPYLVALRVAISDASRALAPRAEALRERQPKKKPSKRGMAPDPGLPLSVAYVFGLGVIEPAGASARADDSKRAAAARKTALQTALEGMLPGSDHAVAAMLRRLDRDTSADLFAAFLQAWRNGGESFYEALDRTAGTEQSLFYYDAMLGDFVGLFSPSGSNSSGKHQGLAAAHDALHQSFLAYRQYRAFREAVALSLVLPPDRPFPRHLSRYEEAPAGTYSLRDQVVMVLAVEGYDPLAVVDLIAASAPPLPDPLWSGRYDPFATWGELFRQRIAKMVAEVDSTDAYLAESRAQLTACSAEIASTTWASLAEAGIRIR